MHGFQQLSHVKTVVFWVVFQIQTWGIFSWRLQMFMSYLHRLCGWKAGERSWNCQWRLTKYYFWNHCWVQSFVWNSPANRKEAHELAVGLCKVCYLVVNHWAEAALIFGCKKYGYDYLFLPHWFAPLWFPLMSKNEIIVTRALYQGHP